MDDLPLPPQMQLSGKLKTFSEFFIAFFKSTLNFEHFEKKISFTAQVFLKLYTPKDNLLICIKGLVSENPLAVNVLTWKSCKVITNISLISGLLERVGICMCSYLFNKLSILPQQLQFYCHVSYLKLSCYTIKISSSSRFITLWYFLNTQNTTTDKHLKIHLGFLYFYV